MLKPKQYISPQKSGQWKPAKAYNGRAKIDAMYDEAWARYSKAFLTINKTCYSCGVKSEVVDHLVPHKGDEKLFKKLDNHIPLCHRCHNTVTSLFDRNHKPGNKDITPKLKWLAKSRERFFNGSKVYVLPTYGE